MSKAFALVALVLAAVFAAVAAKRTMVLSMQRCAPGDPVTLHGLWPQWAQDCKAEPFDYGKLAPIMTQMEKNWMTCPQHGSTNEKFWRHEYEKHGSCLYPSLSMFQYFETTLGLHQKYADLCANQTMQEVFPGAGFYAPVPNKECRLCIDSDFNLC